jgi:hypothetical protein
MDLSQVKLSKTEWENIEIPVSPDEKKILTLICEGFRDPEIHSNANLSLLSFIKMENTKDNDIYLFQIYFEKNIQNLLKKHTEFAYTFSSDLKGKIKEPRKIDKMKMANMEKNIEHHKQYIFEFLLFDFAKNILEKIWTSDHGFYLYTLIQFKKSSIPKINNYLQHFVNCVIEYASERTKIADIIHSAEYFIEKNKYLIKYEDLTLFSHQKELFSLFNQITIDNNNISNNDNNNNSKSLAKLVLYTAPTGTGKTLSPLGLSEGYKIIFVCVARHIGLSLGKSSVSMGKHIAVAFGCETASDIRLHNFSASSFIQNRKSGGIYKIDHSVGDKVDIMICDVKSYIVAMHYMLSFNKEETIITYWDEPTITMDQEEHELHELIHRNWTENKISKFVLSCATLPAKEEISATIVDFEEKFKRTCIEDDLSETIVVPLVHNIVSYDCKKSITLLNKEGRTTLPHLIFAKYSDVLKCVEHCLKNKTILRYFDLGEIIRFIEYVFVRGFVEDETYWMNNKFSSMSEITMISLKIYYLEILKNLDYEKWSEIFAHLSSTQTSKFHNLVSNVNTKSGNELRKIKSEDIFTKGRQQQTAAKDNTITRTQSVDATTKSSTHGVLLTTLDAHTLTDGPTIFIVEDVLKIGKFYIQQSKIPPGVFSDIMNKIEENNILQKKIGILEKSIEDELGKEAEKEKKMEKEHFTGEVRRMKSELSVLQSQIRSIQMNEVYIPNCKEHQKKWIDEGGIVENAFVPTIEEENIRRIMMLEVDTEMKLLLLLGIGVFVTQPNAAYMEIMKSLAYEQKLYLIIASSDYIYGTNYQFCHGFIGKDLTNMTQQKTIQAMGRIGRNNIQQDYTVRFRDDEILMKLFTPIERNLEAINMSMLFCGN